MFPFHGCFTQSTSCGRHGPRLTATREECLSCFFWGAWLISYWYIMFWMVGMNYDVTSQSHALRLEHTCTANLVAGWDHLQLSGEGQFSWWCHKSGKHTKNYWKWPIEIVDLPIENGVYSGFTHWTWPIEIVDLPSYKMVDLSIVM